MQSLIDGERGFVIDAVAQRHLPDARQTIAGTHFPHVQCSDQLQECLLKETVFVFFVEQELQRSFPVESGNQNYFTDILARFHVGVCLTGLGKRKCSIDMRTNPTLRSRPPSSLDPFHDFFRLVPHVSEIQTKDATVFIQ